MKKIDWMEDWEEEEDIISGDKVVCIKSWRGNGGYIFGGGSAYTKGKEIIVIFVVKDGNDKIYLVEDKIYHKYDTLYSFKEPYFYDYFKKV